MRPKGSLASASGDASGHRDGLDLDGRGLQKRLSEDEIRRVLRDAAELQVGQGVSGGLTIEELRSVAAEAGIESRFVDVAVAMLRSSAYGAEASTPVRWYRRRMVPGAVPLEHMDRILHAIRKTFGEEGKLNLLSGRMEWTGTFVVLGVTGRGSATEVDVTADHSVGHLLTHIALPVVGLVAGAVLAAVSGASGLLLLLGLGLGATAGHFAARFAWSRYARSFQEKIDSNFERIASEVAAQAR